MGFQRHAPRHPDDRPAPFGRRRRLRGAARCLALGLAALAMGCAAPAEGVAEAAGSAPAAQAVPAGAPQIGTASFYARRFAGRRMANGQRFDPASDTVAHRSLPFGTVVRVTNLDNGRTATARVHDRGPWIRGRIVDVSPRIARELDMIRSGLARVEVVPMQEVAEAAD